MTVAKFTDVSGEVRLIGELTGATLADETPHWATVTLTSAQILALETTPVTLVAAPGSGKIIFPAWHLFHYRPGATPYTGDASKLQAGFGSTVAVVIGVGQTGGLDAASAASFSMADFLAQATAAYAGLRGFAAQGAFLTAQCENLPLALAANDGVGMSAGNGTLTVSTLYSVLDATATS
jgi:hypothetical protein